MVLVKGHLTASQALSLFEFLPVDLLIVIEELLAVLDRAKLLLKHPLETNSTLHEKLVKGIEELDRHLLEALDVQHQ